MNRQPNPKGQPIINRKPQHYVELPDLDIFEKKEGVEYFAPALWHSFPFEPSDKKGGHRHGKGGEDVE